MQVIHFAGEKSKEKLVEDVILENYNKYYRLAYSYVHNATDAEDIVQNGVYKALRSSRTLKNEEYVGSFVYRIIINEIFDFLRKPKMESFEQRREETGMAEAHTEDVYEDVDLKRALDNLPAQEKAIVMMRYFEDKKLEEIAEILNENLSTIKSRLYRSMKKLRISLQED